MVINGSHSFPSSVLVKCPFSLALDLPDHMPTPHREGDERRSFSTRARALRLRRLNPRMVMSDEVRWIGASGLVGDWVGSEWERLGVGAEAREVGDEGRGGTGGGCSVR